MVGIFAILAGPVSDKFGRRRILALFDLPPFLAGVTLSFQGFVFENGAPTFTRALEITVEPVAPFCFAASTTLSVIESSVSAMISLKCMMFSHWVDDS